LLERERRDCVERGYVLIAVLLEHVFGGDHEAAHATAVEIGDIGERFGDQDLVALGLMEQGHAQAAAPGHSNDRRLVARRGGEVRLSSPPSKLSRMPGAELGSGPSRAGGALGGRASPLGRAAGRGARPEWLE
jgi:hypothetical protein